MSSDQHSLAELKIERDARPKRQFPFGTVLLLLAVVAGGAGLWRWLNPPGAVVRTLIVRDADGAGQRTVLNASGYVTPRREATVSSKVTGKVTEVLIEEGMHVQAGQVLARLDDTNVKTSLRLAEAQLDSSRNALAETRIRIREADQEL